MEKNTTNKIDMKDTEEDPNSYTRLNQNRTKTLKCH